MENRSSPDRVHGMLMAQSALLFALIRTLSPEQLELLKVAYHEESENGLALILNASCPEPLREGFQSQLEAQLALLNSFQP